MSCNANNTKKKIKIILSLVALFLCITLGITRWPQKYPDNEWHSRHECKRLHLLHIASALNVYSDKHNDEMPDDLYNLVEENILDKYHLVCPSQYSAVKKAGFFEDDCSLFVSSYRLVIHGIKYNEIPDGTVILKELSGNHPSSKVGEELYPSGYHALVKKGETFKVEFFEVN